MDTFLRTIQDIFDAIPIALWVSIATVMFLVIVLCGIRIYFRITAGVCNIDQDMSGKTILITGSSAGIGEATAFDLAQRNARIIMACRNIEKANNVAEKIMEETGNRNIVVKYLDLTSFESVKKCAKDVLKTEESLHALINNAGILGGRGQFTEDGCEIIMQTNHFGHFLLTLLLLDLLKKSAPSRIINVSSEAYRHGNLDINELNKRLVDFEAYANSKLANILFTKELAKRLAGTGVTVNALHPGAIKTDITNIGFCRLYFIMHLIFFLNGKTPKVGAQTSIQLAIDPELEQTTGRYFDDCKEAPLTETALDEVQAKLLFKASEKITGVKLPNSENI